MIFYVLLYCLICRSSSKNVGVGFLIFVDQTYGKKMFSYLQEIMLKINGKFRSSEKCFVGSAYYFSILCYSIFFY